MKIERGKAYEKQSWLIQASIYCDEKTRQVQLQHSMTCWWIHKVGEVHIHV